jgi:hypothetical protein
MKLIAQPATIADRDEDPHGSNPVPLEVDRLTPAERILEQLIRPHGKAIEDRHRGARRVNTRSAVWAQRLATDQPALLLRLSESSAEVRFGAVRGAVPGDPHKALVAVHIDRSDDPHAGPPPRTPIEGS